VPEEGVGEGLLVEPRNVYRDQGALTTACYVDGLGEKLLARPCLPVDEDRLGALADGLHVTEEGAHPRIAGQNLSEGSRIAEPSADEGVREGRVLLPNLVEFEGLVNMGGGFPANYLDPTDSIAFVI
jgi:hypothetical protein